jgi:hypothetical protein
MMTLVEDDEAEAPSDVLHMNIRRIVGGDRQLAQLVTAASDDPDFGTKAGAQ